MSVFHNSPAYCARMHETRFVMSPIINRLRQACGGAVTALELADAAYGSGKWPEYWYGGITRTIAKLRKEGWPIGTIRNGGYYYDPSLVKSAAAPTSDAPETDLWQKTTFCQLFSDVLDRRNS